MYHAACSVLPKAHSARRQDAAGTLVEPNL